MKKLQKERKTVAAMIQIFCNGNHGSGRKLLCPACTQLLDYANERLNKCPYGENKGACSKCKVHCYKPDMRKQITDVMRYSGPKMVTKHPLLAVDHLIKTRISKRPKKRIRKLNYIL